MSNPQIQAGFIVDGQIFKTRQEANDYIRRPKILAALNKITKNNDKLSAFLIDKEDEIGKAFEAGVVSRVTKSERNKLDRAMDHLVSLNDPKLAFLSENKEAVVSSFRWPAVKRMDEAEKAAETRAALVALAEEQVADWIIANKDAILEAFNAGIEKREINQKAVDALAAHRAMKEQEKKDEEAAKAAGPEAHAKFLAEKKAKYEKIAADKAAAEAAAKAAKTA